MFIDHRCSMIQVYEIVFYTQFLKTTREGDIGASTSKIEQVQLQVMSGKVLYTSSSELLTWLCGR